MCCNKRHLLLWRWGWSCMAACARMWKMWKDEVQRVEMRVCFQECRGQGGECAPCGPPSLLRSSSVALYPLRPVGEAQIFSFIPLQGAAVASPSLQRSSFTVLEASDCKDRALCLSHHFQDLLCCTYSPEPQCVTQLHCYHTLICNLNPQLCIFSFPSSTVSTRDSAVICCSPKCS